MKILELDYPEMVQMLNEADVNMAEVIGEYKDIKYNDRIPSMQKALLFFNAFERMLDDAEDYLEQSSDVDDWERPSFAVRQAEQAEYCSDARREEAYLRELNETMCASELQEGEE
mgnify:CR=1 FL=1